MGSSNRAPPPPPLSINAKNRTNSYSSDFSSPDTESPSLYTRKDSNDSSFKRRVSSPTVNVYTTCGRHTDQYLFGGRSLTELARSVWKRD